MLLKKTWSAGCAMITLTLFAGCRTSSGGKNSDPPIVPEQECQADQTGAKDMAADFKEELLKQGPWSKDGDRWKAQNGASMIFKSIVLAQEKPGLLQTPGQTAEEKWTAFYNNALQIQNGELSLAPVGVFAKSCP
jgi:hypothetical protein